MKNGKITFLCCLFLTYWASAGPGAEEHPRRVAYFEAGPFWLFNRGYREFQAALAAQDDCAVVYPPELHFSPGWNAGPGDLDAVAEAIQARDDVDLIVVAGTAAARAILRTNNGATPVIGIGIADPVAAGVVAGADDSGTDNFTCEVIVDRWKQMIRVFHDVVGFSLLGVIFPEGPEGRIYSAVDDARAVGEELGFEVLEREMPGEDHADCAEGLRWLHENGADAFFIGPLNCFDWELGDPSALLRQINAMYKMPSFARDGSIFVQGGALMGFATWDFSQTGERLAKQALAIFQGAKPRDLPMRASMEPLIAINLQTARELEFDLPFDILIAADEIYAVTTKPELE